MSHEPVPERRAALTRLARAIQAPEPPHPRPPGAAAEAEFRARCTGPVGCTDCVTACPHGAIGLYPAGTRHHALTPALDPNTAPCHLCEDAPCAVACTTGALVPVPPDAFFFGLARIVERRCFVFQGPECGACAPACPVGALRMQAGRPVIQAEACNGCGLCREACPVWDKAIVIDL